MTQTWLGRILCRLGLHLLVWKTAENGSIVGGCVRCQKWLGWDF